MAVWKHGLEIVVVPHTHWDREWVLPFEGYRSILVDMVDRLLGVISRDHRFNHFMLDSQAIVVEDYLEVRPESRGETERAVRAGRISLGPWYTLPDEFLVSGESLVRNLAVGLRISRLFGQHRSEGYSPDSFGHVSQFAQVLRGVGIDTAVFARGLADEHGTAKAEFFLESPDGSSLFAHYLFRAYFNAATLRVDPYRPWGKGELPCSISLVDHVGYLAERGTAGVVLLMNGGDHLAAQEDLPDVVEELRGRLPEFMHIRIGSLAEFLAAVRERQPVLTVVRGELRGSRYWQMFGNALSARTYLKQRNRQVEALLEGAAEPTSAVGQMLGVTSRRERLLKAWRYCLQNHAHDSISGTFVDEVAKDVEMRFDRAEQIAEHVLEASLGDIAGRLPPDEGEGRLSVLVFNPSNWPRTGEVRVGLDPVGRKLERRFDGLESVFADDDARALTLCDDRGFPHSFSIGGRRRVLKDVLEGVRVVEEQGVTFLAREVPPYGYRLYHFLRDRQPVEEDAQVVAGEGVVENAFYRVSVQPDGRLTLLDKAARHSFTDLLAFEDGGDAGDTYNYAAPPRDTVVTEPDSVSWRAEGNGWRGALHLRVTLKLPCALAPDRVSRSSQTEEVPIDTSIILWGGVPRVEFRTTFNNAVRDHRLRVLFPTDVDADRVRVESPYDIVERLRCPHRGGPGWAEQPLATQPQGWFVEVVDSVRKNLGFALVNEGIAEYELLRDRTSLALTLVRGVGWVSRPDVPARPGSIHDLPAPGAQCLRLYRFRYAIVPSSAASGIEGLYDQVSAFRTGLRACQVVPGGGGGTGGGGALPASLSLLRVEPRNVIVSAIKPADAEDALVVRVFNPTDEPRTAIVRAFRPALEACSVNLLEQGDQRTDVRVTNGAVLVPVAARQIRTIKIQRWGPA